MNSTIINNYSKLKPTLFIFPALLLLAMTLFLFEKNALQVNSYIGIQKDAFFYINSVLSKFPNLEYNLTQLGDALISLSLLSLFLIYAPVIWETLISVSIIAMIVSWILKNIFAVPRPAAVFDTDSFTIIGQTLTGHNSLPSGHSMTIFTTLTVLLFAFIPAAGNRRIIWFTGFILIGLFLALSRVAVGAHHPLDVLAGSTVGYVSGLTGIFLSRKYKIWSWISDKKYHPLLIILLIIAFCLLCLRIKEENLPVFYISLIIVIFTLYKLIHDYFKK